MSVIAPDLRSELGALLRSGGLAQILSEQLNLVPIPPGTVSAWAGDATNSELLPAGWFPCDGRELDRASYAPLFRAIGVRYGTGNGYSTFNLPDLRGRVVIAAGQGAGLTNRALASSGGSETHTLTTAELPAHTHTITDQQHAHSSPSGQSFMLSNASLGGVAAGGINWAPTSFSSQTDSRFTGITGTNSAGLGGAHNNVPPYLALSYLIKA